MKLNLNNYDKIIFDMDGVITSELAYWQSAALAAYDLLLSHEHYGVCGIDRHCCREQYEHIYNTIMCGGRTVRAVKRLGVNTNWDLLYIVFCVSKYINPELDTMDASHFQSVCMFIENIEQTVPELYFALGELAAQTLPGYPTEHFKRGGEGLWRELFDTFDLWYSGCGEFDGIRESETLLFDSDDLAKLFKALKAQGLKLGIGTGRPKAEIDYPLSANGLHEFFDKSLFASFDEVCAAETALKPELPLAKPDPFVFLKAALGGEYSDREIYERKFDKARLSRTLIVGDAPSDLLSAKAAGFDFLGVLTGVEGDGMLGYFTDNGADFILNSVFDMIDLENDSQEVNSK